LGKKKKKPGPDVTKKGSRKKDTGKRKALRCKPSSGRVEEDNEGKRENPRRIRTQSWERSRGEEREVEEVRESTPGLVECK